jgi:hypothetical protein
MQEVYFENIRNIIIQELEKSTRDIKIAVAWFTDKKIINILESKINQGITIELIFYNDKINKKEYFEKLYYDKAKIYLSKNKLMHNKFCIIDYKTVLNGSYNWTNSAESNHENVQITRELKIVEKFLDQFENLKISLPTIDNFFKYSPTQLDLFVKNFENYKHHQKIKLKKFPFIVNFDSDMLSGFIYKSKQRQYIITNQEEANDIFWILFVIKSEFSYNQKKINDYANKTFNYPKKFYYQIFDLDFIDDNFAILNKPKHKVEDDGKVFFIDNNSNLIGEKSPFSKKLENGMYINDFTSSKEKYLLDENLNKFILKDIYSIIEVKTDIGIFCTKEYGKKIGLIDFQGKELVPFIFNHYKISDNKKTYDKEVEFILFPIYSYEDSGYSLKKIEKTSSITKENYNNFPYLKRIYSPFLKQMFKPKDGELFLPKGFFSQKKRYAIPYKDKELILRIENRIKVQEQIRKEEYLKLKEKQGCYIATIIYNDFNNPNVIILRNFRDKKLKKSILGRKFVYLYYRLSPNLIKIFYKSKFINNYTKKVLDYIIPTLKNHI